MKIKLYLLFIVLSTSLFAQQKQVSTSIDTTKNKIGAEFKLTLKTTVKATSKVTFPNLKNVGPLEVIESYPIDTIKKNDQLELIKKYGLLITKGEGGFVPTKRTIVPVSAFQSPVVW